MANSLSFNTLIPQLKEDVTVKEWRRLFECAVAGLADDKARIAYIPFAVQRSSADTKWALEAIKKTTLRQALDELEARIDGKKTRLVAASEFFNLKPASEISKDSELSAFFFDVLEKGAAATVPHDLVMLKFIQFVPQASKLFDGCEADIKPDMTEASMVAIFDKVRKKLSKNNVPESAASHVQVKQEVFYSGEDRVPQWAADLRNQVEGIKEVLGMQETSSEAASSDDQAYYSNNKAKKSEVLKNKLCSICSKKNHSAENCYQRICAKCNGKGHDKDNCPSVYSKSYRKKPSSFKKKSG